MYTEVLRDISGIAVFPVLSLVVFVLVFSAVLVWTARLDRVRLEHLARLPLGDENAEGAATELKKEPDRETHTR